MSEISYEEVRRMADQLSHDEREALIVYLLKERPTQKLSTEEWTALFNASILPGRIEGFSDRREDWYDDDGR
jgi:hypothetical protein